MAELSKMKFEIHPGWWTTPGSTIRPVCSPWEIFLRRCARACQTPGSRFQWDGQGRPIFAIDMVQQDTLAGNVHIDTPLKRVSSFSGHCGSSGRNSSNWPLTFPKRHFSGPVPYCTCQWKVRCLVDSGSQVILFSQGLCNELFGVQQLLGVEAPRLTLWDANRLVIIRDQSAHQALLCMNVISVCLEALFESGEWEHIIADCQRFEAAWISGAHEDTALGACHYALTIPAQSEAVVWARLPTKPYGSNNWVLLEPHSECQGVEVARVLATCTGAMCLSGYATPNPITRAWPMSQL